MLTRPRWLEVHLAAWGFYVRASSPRVTPGTAGYHYGATWGLAPAGLAPASQAVSFAALPRRGPPGRVPPLRRYSQGATTSCRPSRRTSWPSLGGTSRVHSLCSLLAGRVRRRGLELLTRSPGRDLAEEATGSPRFLEDPDWPFALFRRRRQDRGHQTMAVPRHGPWDPNSEGSHERSFGAP